MLMNISFNGNTYTEVYFIYLFTAISQVKCIKQHKGLPAKM
jgi:hypothetical protein